MPVSFRILPEHFVVYVRLEGRVTTPQNAAALAACLAHPGYRTGMRQLIDLRAVSGWDRDFTALMKHQAREAEIHTDPLHPTVIVCHAPTGIARSLAHIVNRTWEQCAQVVTVTVETEPEALAVLGVKARSFAALLEPA